MADSTTKSQLLDDKSRLVRFLKGRRTGPVQGGTACTHMLTARVMTVQVRHLSKSLTGPKNHELYYSQVAYARASVISDRFRTFHFFPALLTPSLCPLHHSKIFSLVHNRNQWFSTYLLRSVVSSSLQLLLSPGNPLCPLVTSLFLRLQFAVVVVPRLCLL